MKFKKHTVPTAHVCKQQTKMQVRAGCVRQVDGAYSKKSSFYYHQFGERNYFSNFIRIQDIHVMVPPYECQID